jgi:hypothetical protein
MFGDFVTPIARAANDIARQTPDFVRKATNTLPTRSTSKKQSRPSMRKAKR